MHPGHQNPAGQRHASLSNAEPEYQSAGNLDESPPASGRDATGDVEAGASGRPSPAPLNLDMAAEPSYPMLSRNTTAASQHSAASTQKSGERGFMESMLTTPRTHRSPSRVGESTPLLAMVKYFKLPAEDSVYSYFLFMPPIEQRRTKRFMTPLVTFAFVLVLINFIMQVGLLKVVGEHIMNKHNEWMTRIVHIKNPVWYHIVPMPYNYPPPKCHGEDSTLCMDKGDGISCAPSSVHLLTDWDLLDTDGDGVWSRDESRDDKLRDAVRCDYGLDLALMFDRVAQHLNASHVLKGRRDTDLFSGEGVHKAYFNWFLHKPLLCQYGDSDMCGALFQRGFFDEALRQQPSDEFSDTSRALDYCNHILEHECFHIMPSNYKVWRNKHNEQCGPRAFGQSMFQAPDSDDGSTIGTSIPMLTTSFRIQTQYETTKGWNFRVFLNILLVTFLCVMYLEMISILKTLAWAIQFPTDESAGVDGRVVGTRSVRIKTKDTENDLETDVDEDTELPQAKRQSEAISKSIHAVRTDHRIMVLIVTLMRLCLWVFLLWSGIMFLTGQPRYLTLIFDALSLLFIFEIDELLYRTMLRHEFKTDHLSIEDMKVKTMHGGALSGWKSILRDILMFFLIILFAMLVVYSYCAGELNPIIDALGCLCSRDGPRCYDAQHYSKTWWDNYWSTTLPAANLIIDRLKAV